MAKKLGYIIIGLSLIASFGLIVSIAAGLFSIGFSILPIAIVLAILFLLGYILIRQPDKIEWDIPYIGKILIGAENEIVQAEGFDRIVAVADQESKDLADALRTVRFEFDEDSCEDLSEVLRYGIQSRKTTPIEETMIQMESILHARDFVERSDSLELRVVGRESDVLYAEIEENHSEIREGLEFELYIKDSIHVDGKGDIVSKEVGVARVIQTDSNFCHLEVLHLNDRFNSGSEESLSYIMNHSPSIVFDAERTKGVDWDDLEKAHESLRKLATGGKNNYDN